MNREYLCFKFIPQWREKEWERAREGGKGIEWRDVSNRAMISQADSHVVSLVKNIIMTALTAIFDCWRSRRTKNPSSHICCLQRTQHVMFACIGLEQEIPRGTCVTARRCSTPQFTPYRPYLSPRYFHMESRRKTFVDIFLHRTKTCDRVKKSGSVDSPLAFPRMALIVLSRNRINV